MDEIKTKINKKKQQILKYKNIITNLQSDINELKKEIITNCDHTFESDLLTTGPYIEYVYICTTCDYTTSHIV
jgi:hypothetical protein